MTNFARYAFAVASLSVVVSPAIASDLSSCSIAKIESQRELHEFLSKQAVQIVELARRGEQERLADLVSAAASFSLGSGDVGRPLGTGLQGAKALSKEMNADTYRYLSWDYMDGPAKPCASQKVAVEFVDSRDKTVSQIEFTFEGGRLTRANGWSRSYESGALSPSATH